MTEKPNELLSLALALAQAAEAQIMPYYHKHTVHLKPDGSEVTEADRQAEMIMRGMISERYSNDTILGEEFGRTHTSSNRHQWVIDPREGTTLTSPCLRPCAHTGISLHPGIAKYAF